MTKILQLLHSDEKGGVEALASLIGDDLKAAGAEVTTLFLYPSFDAGLLAKLAGLSRACVQMLRLRPDMILAYQPTASVLAGFVGRAIGCSLHIIHHTSDGETSCDPSIVTLARPHGWYSRLLHPQHR